MVKSKYVHGVPKYCMSEPNKINNLPILIFTEYLTSCFSHNSLSKDLSNGLTLWESGYVLINILCSFINAVFYICIY